MLDKISEYLLEIVEYIEAILECCPCDVDGCAVPGEFRQPGCRATQQARSGGQVTLE